MYLFAAADQSSTAKVPVFFFKIFTQECGGYGLMKTKLVLRIVLIVIILEI